MLRRRPPASRSVGTILALVLAATTLGEPTADAATGATNTLLVGARESISTVDTTTGATGGIGVGGDLNDVVITPDGTRAYATRSNGDVHVIDVAGGADLDHFNRGVNLQRMALSADGRRLVLSNRFTRPVPGGTNDIPFWTTTVFDLQTGERLNSYGYASGSNVSVTAVAITPDGSKALATTSDGRLDIFQISGTGRGLAPHGGTAYDLAVTPDSQIVVMANSTAVQFWGVNAFMQNPSTPRLGLVEIPAGGATSVEIAPAGDVAFTADRAGNVIPISIASRSALPAIATGLTNIIDMVMNPDGRHLHLLVRTASDDDDYVYELDVTTGALVGPMSVADLDDPDSETAHVLFRRGMSVTPQQAPTARFVVTQAIAGAATHFDGSISEAAGGATVANYEWSFGDGTSASGPSPVVDHTYALPGAYPVSLRVTDSTGTSTTRVHTGHQVLRNGGPSAVMATTVQIAATSATSLTASPNPATAGEPVTLTARVSLPAGVPFQPGETVFFSFGGRPDLSVSAPITADGTATATLLDLPRDGYVVVAFYDGTAAATPSQSPEVHLEVLGVPTSIELVSSEDPSDPGDTVTFTGTVSSAPGAPATACAGELEFEIAGELYPPQAVDSTGTTSIVSPPLPRGDHVVRAYYYGSDRCGPGTAQLVQRVGEPEPPPDPDPDPGPPTTPPPTTAPPTTAPPTTAPPTTPPPTTPPSSTPPPSTPAPTNPPATGGGSGSSLPGAVAAGSGANTGIGADNAPLPRTGRDLRPLAAAGAWLVLAGGLLADRSRRARAQRAS